MCVAVLPLIVCIYRPRQIVVTVLPLLRVTPVTLRSWIVYRVSVHLSLDDSFHGQPGLERICVD